MDNTQLTTGATTLAPKQFFEQDLIKKKFAEILGKRSTSFITSVLQIISSNDMLKNATSESIYHAAMVAATLDLPLNNNLGFAYIVPYSNKGVMQAQFQMGYKAFIQLAQRSGQFKSIYASAIYDGQLVEENPLDGYVFDFSKRSSEKVIGYASRFKLLNGFESTYFMSMAELNSHASRFSQTFKRGFGLWKDDFDSMAKKTVIKLNLSKNAPLSVELQRAVISDQSIINDAETLDVDYVDNTPLSVEDNAAEKEHHRLKSFIENATDLKTLQKEMKGITLDSELTTLLDFKIAQLNGK